jgi:formate C-acetyltransferase
MRVTQPTVSFRWHSKTPKAAKLKVVDVVSKGLGMPGLFNDEVIIPTMARKGVNTKEIFDYSILGCVEPIIEGKTDVRPNIGFVNFPKVLEITLNNGKDPKTGMMVGIETGDPRRFKSFDELWIAYRKQLDYTVDLLTKADRVAAQIHAKYVPTSLLSSLLKGCVESGHTMQEGGAEYNAGGIQGVGIAIATDSLSVLRKHVFETRNLKMEQILDALSKNFEGYEDLRVRLENDPDKYGNDIERVDLLAREIGKAFCELSCCVILSLNVYSSGRVCRSYTRWPTCRSHALRRRVASSQQGCSRTNSRHEVGGATGSWPVLQWHTIQHEVQPSDLLVTSRS